MQENAYWEKYLCALYALDKMEAQMFFFYRNLTDKYEPQDTEKKREMMVRARKLLTNVKLELESRANETFDSAETQGYIETELVKLENALSVFSEGFNTPQQLGDTAEVLYKILSQLFYVQVRGKVFDREYNIDARIDKDIMKCENEHKRRILVDLNDNGNRTAYTGISLSDLIDCIDQTKFRYQDQELERRIVKDLANQLLKKELDQGEQESDESEEQALEQNPDMGEYFSQQEYSEYGEEDADDEEEEEETKEDKEDKEDNQVLDPVIQDKTSPVQASKRSLRKRKKTTVKKYPVSGQINDKKSNPRLKVDGITKMNQDLLEFEKFVLQQLNQPQRDLSVQELTTTEAYTLLIKQATEKNLQAVKCQVGDGTTNRSLYQLLSLLLMIWIGKKPNKHQRDWLRNTNRVTIWAKTNETIYSRRFSKDLTCSYGYKCELCGSCCQSRHGLRKHHKYGHCRSEKKQVMKLFATFRSEPAAKRLGMGNSSWPSCIICGVQVDIQKKKALAIYAEKLAHYKTHDQRARIYYGVEVTSQSEYEVFFSRLSDKNGGKGIPKSQQEAVISQRLKNSKKTYSERFNQDDSDEREPSQTKAAKKKQCRDDSEFECDDHELQPTVRKKRAKRAERQEQVDEQQELPSLKKQTSQKAKRKGSLAKKPNKRVKVQQQELNQATKVTKQTNLNQFLLKSNQTDNMDNEMARQDDQLQKATEKGVSAVKNFVSPTTQRRSTRLQDKAWARYSANTMRKEIHNVAGKYFQDSEGSEQLVQPDETEQNDMNQLGGLFLPQHLIDKIPENPKRRCSSDSDDQMIIKT